MIMSYKGYIGKVSFDEDAELFHGEVVNTRDVITFQGKNAAQLKKALKDSVEDYIDFCKAEGEEPNKPFSGNFPMRTSPSLHQFLFMLATAKETSMSKVIEDLVQQKFGDVTKEIDILKIREILDKQA